MWSNGSIPLQLLVDGDVRVGKATENDPFREGILTQPVADGRLSDAGRLVDGIAIDTGRYGWEGDGSELVFRGQFEALSITACQKVRFLVRATFPDRSNGVNDESSRKAVPFGDLGFAGLRPA